MLGGAVKRLKQLGVRHAEFFCIGIDLGPEIAIEADRLRIDGGKICVGHYLLVVGAAVTALVEHEHIVIATTLIRGTDTAVSPSRKPFLLKVNRFVSWNSLRNE